jgi:hypothetical protein
MPSGSSMPCRSPDRAEEPPAPKQGLGAGTRKDLSETHPQNGPGISNKSKTGLAAL